MYTWGDKWAHTALKGNSPKVNVIAPLEFELTCFVVEIVHVSKNSTRTPVGYKVTGKGQGCVAVWYLTPYFGYFILPPRWLVGVTSCPRKSQKNYTKEKKATDKRRRRFFYTFLYLLGSKTIPWMREFFLNTLKWLNSPVKVSKTRWSFHACICPHLVFQASIRVSFLSEVCQSPVRFSL